MRPTGRYPARSRIGYAHAISIIKGRSVSDIEGNATPDDFCINRATRYALTSFYCAAEQKPPSPSATCITRPSMAVC